MKKKLVPLIIVVLLISVMLITEAIASPMQPLANGKPSKTPGAQATANALKWAVKHPEKTKGTSVEKLVVKNFKGEVASFDTTQVVITLKDGTLVTILLTEDTLIKAPKLNPNKKPKVEGAPLVVPALQVGMKVSIKAVVQDSTITALKIRVIPGKPVKVYRVGVVTEYTAGTSLTVLSKSGGSSTFLLTATTKYLPAERMAELAVGRTVTVISPRDVTGAPLVALGVVIHPVVVETP